MKNEHRGRKMTKGHKDSPSVEETCCDGSLGGDGDLKKGPWTAAEDAILVDYVTKHGEGNWNAIHKHSGLHRCGKSCRLRWANHLRPNLKKGTLTSEEEQRVIKLHAKIGNKWARIVLQLPGRTDNEIKNFWNSRIKRLKRTGLPIYPPDLCPQALDCGTLEDSPKTPDLELEDSELDPGILSSFIDVQASPCHDLSLIFPPSDQDLNSDHQMKFDALYGNSSSTELPSLQYSESQQSSSWDMLGSPLPSCDSVDTDLLEAILYESQALKRSKKSPATVNDVASSSSMEVKACEQEWEVPQSSSGWDVEPQDSARLARNKEQPEMEALLDSGWFMHGEDQSVLDDSFRALLGDDYFSDY